VGGSSVGACVAVGSTSVGWDGWVADGATVAVGAWVPVGCAVRVGVGQSVCVGVTVHVRVTSAVTVGVEADAANVAVVVAVGVCVLVSVGERKTNRVAVADGAMRGVFVAGGRCVNVAETRGTSVGDRSAVATTVRVGSRVGVGEPNCRRHTRLAKPRQ
jgi:hypothetical protein